MILNCSSCGAKFKVDPAMLGEAGRNVRCGSCGHSWHQMPPSEGLELVEEPQPAPEIAAAAEPPVESESEPELEPAPLVKPATPPKLDRTLDKLDEQRARVGTASSAVTSERTGTFRAVGWLALLVFVVGLVTAIVAGRDTIIARAPGTSQFYEMVGLQEVIGQGLELRDVVSVRRIVAGEDTLVIEGTIVNISQSPQPVPQLRASLVDDDGVELANWFVSADSTSLPPGGFTTFQTNAANPPEMGNLGLAFIGTRN